MEEQCVRLIDEGIRPASTVAADVIDTMRRLNQEYQADGNFRAWLSSQIEEDAAAMLPGINSHGRPRFEVGGVAAWFANVSAMLTIIDTPAGEGLPSFYEMLLATSPKYAR